MFAAHQQWPHSRKQEVVCLPVGEVFPRRETIQSAVYAGGAYEAAYRGETTQVYGKYIEPATH